jgi:hypothetical protein|tara:strand:+ start:412 stop:729 length:318 start_codon:yes stop_codon:yes gene_type:complete
MDEIPEWVWYQDKIALVRSLEPQTGFVELQVLEKHQPDAPDGVSTWEAMEDSVIAAVVDTRPMTEYEIEEIRPGVFQLDEGDVTYEPSTEDSTSESELEEEEYNL